MTEEENQPMRLTAKGETSFVQVLRDRGATEFELARFRRLSPAGKVFVRCLIDQGHTPGELISSAAETERRRRQQG